MRVLVAAAVVAMGLLGGACSGGKPKPIVVGKASPTPEPTPFVPGTPVPEVAAPELAPKSATTKANVFGPPPELSFRGAVNVPDDLLFFLVIGSDSRPGQEVTRGRADSLHIVAVDPVSKKGTLVGIPRDSWVDVPGHGKAKINSAMSSGGPDLVVQTVRNLTGLPISYYAVTGFEGIVAMTDELHGLDVQVKERMQDSDSGANFEPGWHHMDGRQVLAFSRNRHLGGGDFTRSRNQGQVIVHTLEKLRAAVEEESGIRYWLSILYKHAAVKMPFEDAVRFGILARTLLPADIGNTVASGQSKTVGGQSIVELDEQAYALFRDVGADAIADGRQERAPAPAEPTPAPTPEPAPTPTPISFP